MRKTDTPRGRRWLLQLGIVIIVVYCLAPFYWMVVSAFRKPNEQGENTWLPSPWSLENFEAVFGPDVGFGRSLLNSVVVAGTTTVLTLIVGTFAAYTLARLNFRFKNAAAGIIIATSMFPGISLIVPLLKLFTEIGWINTYQAMVLPSLSFALPLAVWTLATFFRQMPKELEEAAMVDGLT
ncbi:MAG TPA: carbohydrate ABC transporter permease, partial [Actinophytocola sp.]|nr:carbohydrate ABC transporter permease [Actinophytocola sp.]